MVQKYADLMLVSLANYQTLKWTVPGKIQFYFQCKKPILGALSGDAKTLIEKSNSGIVTTSGNYKNLSKILDENAKFIKTKKFQKKGLNGFNYSRKNFNKRKIISFLSDIMSN